MDRASSSRTDTGTAASSASTAPGPVVMTRDQLAHLAATAGHSIYWAGDRGLSRYEVTLVGRDIYVRYVPAGAAAGSTTPYLTVGTYEKSDAYNALVDAAKASGATSERLTAGALVVQPAGKPTSAYFAFPNVDLLVEVYDPAPGKAYGAVESGSVQPIS